MKTTHQTLILIAGALMTANGAVTVTYDDADITESYMNAHFLTANGGGGKGAFAFGGGWGIGDLVAVKDASSNSVTLSPNTIGDPNEYWYQNTSGTAADPVNPGGPGQLGNKWMEANLYRNISDGSFAGETLTFKVDVSAFSLTGAHTLQLFIGDFNPDYSDPIFTETAVTGTGLAEVTATLINDPARIVQYGFRFSGENVWVTDVAPFGSATIGAVAIPEPSSSLLSLAGVGFLAFRRRK